MCRLSRAEVSSTMYLDADLKLQSLWCLLFFSMLGFAYRNGTQPSLTYPHVWDVQLNTVKMR